MKTGNNNNNNNKYNRNKSFGGGPTSPKKTTSGGGGGGRGSGKQPARRSVSHDAQKLRQQFQQEENNGNEEDGFTTVSSKHKSGGSGGRFSNVVIPDGNTSKNNTAAEDRPKGRVNPTSSFSRPRNTASFNKPRPTGSFKKTRESFSKNNNGSSSSFHHSNSSIDNSSSGPPTRDTRRHHSFNKPRPTGSFNAKIGNANNSNTAPSTPIKNARARQESFKRSVSRLTSNDVELYVPGDGKTEAQRQVVRIHVDHFLQTRLQHLDPPSFDGTIAMAVMEDGSDNNNNNNINKIPNNIAPSDKDQWNPHHKCIWNDPARREQIEQLMQQYPNAIPLHMKKRTRIKSSRLGDATPAILSSSSVVSNDDTNSEAFMADDSSMGASMSEQGGAVGIALTPMSDVSFILSVQEDMNPLRKTLLVLNKLSWTTIDKMTTKLFEILEHDVPNLMSMQQASVPPTSIRTSGHGGGDDAGTPTTKSSSDGDEAAIIPESSTASEIVAETPTDASSAPASTENDNSENPGTTTTSAAVPNGDNTKNPSTTLATPTPAASTTELSPMIVTILTLVVEKAQSEPHFSAMYAQLCKNLADRNQAWKRKMLAHCQNQFEHDIAWHTARLDEALQNKSKQSQPQYLLMEDVSSNTNNTAATEEMDREYQVLQLRKRYLGHVQLVGELFKLKMIKLDILIWCLSRLLFNKEHVDEDDLECFAKLMTVAGEEADSLVRKGKCHALAEEKWYQCWDRVYFLTGRKKQKQNPSKSSLQPRQQGQGDTTEKPEAEATPPKISSRIKFMLVDLLELEENDWVHRRQKDEPKTIAEIHEEVREEEEEARRRSFSDDFSFSSNRRRFNSDEYIPPSPQYNIKPQKMVSPGGFIDIPKRASYVRRAVSDVEVSDIYNKPTRGSKKKPTPVPSSPTSRSRTVISQIQVSNATPKIVEYPEPQDCKEKAKVILKEYFVGGDTKEAIHSIDEIVGAGRENEDHGSVDRGAAVIESGVLLVMEMKQQEVQKFLAVIKRCLQKKKLEKESIPRGLKDPLEFLSDIEIDAPLARSLLTSIVAYWVRQEVLPFDFLLDAPEYFRTDGKPAEFAAGVLKVRGGDVTEEDVSVVEKLMTEDDKKKFASPKELIAPQT